MKKPCPEADAEAQSKGAIVQCKDSHMHFRDFPPPEVHTENGRTWLVVRREDHPILADRDQVDVMTALTMAAEGREIVHVDAGTINRFYGPTKTWRYIELCPGVETIEGPIVGKRVRMRGGHREFGTVRSEADGLVYLDLDGSDLYVCNRTNFTIEE